MKHLFLCTLPRFTVYNAYTAQYLTKPSEGTMQHGWVINSRPVLAFHTPESRCINKVCYITHSSSDSLITVMEESGFRHLSFNNTVLPQCLSTLKNINIGYWFTVGEGVRKRHPMAGQLLKGPELVHTVEYSLGPVDQPTAHLLQVAQHSDVTIWLHPGRGHPHHHHLWIRCYQFLLHSQTWNMR